MEMSVVERIAIVTWGLPARKHNTVAAEIVEPLSCGCESHVESVTSAMYE